MNWRRLIAELLDSGMTQVGLAAECGVAQSTISDLFRGASKSTSWEVGQKLRDLHATRLSRAGSADSGGAPASPTGEASHAG